MLTYSQYSSTGVVVWSVRLWADAFIPGAKQLSVFHQLPVNIGFVFTNQI
jgi:hypothetical protein